MAATWNDRLYGVCVGGKFVNRERGVAVDATLDEREAVDRGDGVATGVLDDDDGRWAELRSRNQGGEHLARLRDVGPGGIAEDEVERSREPGACALGALGEHGGALRLAEGLDVGAERRQRGAVALDEGGVRRTPAEGLEPERPRPGVEIQDRPAGDGALGGQDREEGFADPVGRRARGRPLRRLEDARAVDARGDAHGVAILEHGAGRDTVVDMNWRTWALIPSLLFSLLVMFAARAAHADNKSSAVHVISLDSDDATEDHADAFTAILKVRLRSTPGWQLAESNTTMATLGPALRCPAHPDPPCLQRIADQLKTDRFFWGKVSPGPQPHMVTAEIHLWIRGKAEQVVKDTYSDNLKDQNDDSLKRVVNHIFDKLAGVSSDGIVNIKANVETGVVLVDGKEMAKLDRGAASLTLPAGSHTVTVESIQGTTTLTTGAQPVTVAAGGEISLAVELKPGAVVTPISPEQPGKPAPVQKIIGISTMGVGAVLGIVGIIEGVVFLGKKSQNQDDVAAIPDTFTDICQFNQYKTQCDNLKSAEMARTLGFVFGGAGVALIAVGAVVFATAPSTQEAPKNAFRILPKLGPNGGGVDVALTF